MDNIDGIITKDKVYRLLSDFRAYIPNDIRHQMIEKVKALPSIDDWISVKDRMPKNNTPVLVVWTNNKVSSVMLGWHISIKGLGSDWQTSGGLRPEEEITHWMPLPEPPEL